MHTDVGKLEEHDLVRRTPEDAVKVCQTYFGKPRQDGSSHAIFKTPWPGDPRVNIQNAKGKAKPYQVSTSTVASNLKAPARNHVDAS